MWSHDGARYFNCSAIKAVLKSLDVPVMVSAPHSYNVAPSELVFASVKAINLNLERLPTGKTHFLNVGTLVLARLKDLKPSQRVLLWHHVAQHLYRFLGYQRL